METKTVLQEYTRVPPARTSIQDQQSKIYYYWDETRFYKWVVDSEQWVATGGPSYPCPCQLENEKKTEWVVHPSAGAPTKCKYARYSSMPSWTNQPPKNVTMQDPVSGVYYRWEEHQLYKWDRSTGGWVFASHSSMCTEVPEVPGGVDVNGAEPNTKHQTPNTNVNHSQPLLVEKQQEGLNGYAAKVALGAGILAAGGWLTANWKSNEPTLRMEVARTPALAMDI